MKLKYLPAGRSAVLLRACHGFDDKTIITVGDMDNDFAIVGCGVRNAEWMEDLGNTNVRPLTSADAVEIDENGILRLKQPSPAKSEGVHPRELAVGQLGLVVVGSEPGWKLNALFLRIHNILSAMCFQSVMGGLLIGAAEDCIARVQPYPVGSKIVPQPNGSIVVEEPEAKPLTWDDLNQGDYFTDSEGDLGIKTDEGCVVWLDVAESSPGLSFDVAAGELTRVTPAEAAAIIAASNKQ